jgi:hypothetical protein
VLFYSCRSRVTIEVEDGSGSTLFDGYDNVMVNMDSVGHIDKVMFNVCM